MSATSAPQAAPDLAPAQPLEPARRAGVDRRAMTVLSLGHMFTDIAQGSIPALLPFLVADNHISIAAASALVLAATISSSVVQPAFGYMSDRVSLPWLMPLGPALGGLGVALVGFAPNYALTFAAVLLSGLGVAAFHPEGSRFANYVSGARRASGMSRFSVGGNVGFALGPVVVTPLLILFGLHGTAFILIPTWLMAAVLCHELPRLKTFRKDVVGGRVQQGDQHEAWRPFAILAGVIALRSFVYFGLVTFIPLYYVNVLHTSKALGSAALSAMLLGGAVGTLTGGPLADRFGRRNVLIGSMLVTPPLVVAFVLSGPVRRDPVRGARRRRDDRDVRGHDRDGAGVPAGAARRVGGRDDRPVDRPRRHRCSAAWPAGRRPRSDRRVRSRRGPAAAHAPSRVRAAAADAP